MRVPAARVAHWSWRAAFGADGAADIAIEVVVDGAARTVNAWLFGHGAGVEANADVVDGRASLSLRVDDPQRWWCAGFGKQPLYDLTIRLDDDADTVDARIGWREVELVREPDDAGESFYFRVNGTPIFAKGANWIPDDSFPSRTPPERVRRLLELAVECGMNMIRIWGGGL